MKKQILTILVSVLVSTLALAHGVHDAGEVKPQKGGVLRSLETVNVELLQIGKEIRIYLYDKKLKPLDPKKYKASAKAILPRKKGEAELKLRTGKNYWITKFDAKGVHRYSLVFFIQQGGHNDKLTFVIEPKR